MSHTPAPWIWWTSNSWKRLLHDLGHGRSANVLQPYVCPDGHPDCEVREADMSLIAASPDLLAALKGVVRVADRKTDEFDAARAAIAKAEGRQLAK